MRKKLGKSRKNSGLGDELSIMLKETTKQMLKQRQFQQIDKNISAKVEKFSTKLEKFSTKCKTGKVFNKCRIFVNKRQKNFQQMAD